MNENEIKEKINEILNSNKLKNSIKRKGLNQAKKFSWKKCAKETLEVYKSVLE